MAFDFRERFLENNIIRDYDSLLVGEDHLDRILFGEYADIFFNLSCMGRRTCDVLDMGCGPAPVGVEMARRLPGGSFHFLDRSPGMIEKAKKNVRRKLQSSDLRFDYTISDAENLLDYISPRSKDVVMARFLMQFQEQPEDILLPAYSALRNGGKLIFNLSGFNTYNFNFNGNSLFGNWFYSSLAYASAEVLPEYIDTLPDDAQNYLIEEGLITKLDKNIALKKSSFDPLFDHEKILKSLLNIGVTGSQITHLVLPQTQTVNFRKKYSGSLGSVPLPGVWDILPLFGQLERINIVNEIYNKAFDCLEDRPFMIYDPIYIVTK